MEADDVSSEDSCDNVGRGRCVADVAGGAFFSKMAAFSGFFLTLNVPVLTREPKK